MSALIISHDLHIMMLELSVEKLYVPRTSVFDSVLMKKTTVRFRMLDDEWTVLCPHRSDYRPYRGSNYESEPFYGGKSIVFSIPEASLQKRMTNVDLQMHISKDVSRYFEMHPSQNVGFVIVRLDKLFNGIIKELRERKELAPYLHLHEREPISRSLKETFPVLDDNSEETASKIDLYIRISYFGKSIITEIATPETVAKAFYVQEETNQMYPYQCRELKPEEVEGGSWGSVSFIPPTKLQNLKCDCQNEKTEELLEMQKNDGSKKEDAPTKDDVTIKGPKENYKGKGKDKEKRKGKGKDKSKVSDEDIDDKIRNENTEISDVNVDEKEKEEDKGGGKKKKGKVEKGKKAKPKKEENKDKEIGTDDKGKGKDGNGKQKADREKQIEEDKGSPKDDAKGRKETSLDAEIIRRLKRRNAGPCTIGISEKKRPCLSASPCAYKICTESPPICPSICPPINCHFCQEISTFGCC